MNADEWRGEKPFERRPDSAPSSKASPVVDIAQKRRALTWTDEEIDAAEYALKESGMNAARFVRGFLDMTEKVRADAGHPPRIPLELQRQLERMEAAGVVHTTEEFRRELTAIVENRPLPTRQQAAPVMESRPIAMENDPEWVPAKDIAEMLNRNIDTVERWVGRYGLERREVEKQGANGVRFVYSVRHAHRIAKQIAPKALGGRRPGRPPKRRELSRRQPAPRVIPAPFIPADQPPPPPPDRRDPILIIIKALYVRDGVMPRSVCPVCKEVFGEKHAVDTGHGVFVIPEHIANSVRWMK